MNANGTQMNADAMKTNPDNPGTLEMWALAWSSPERGPRLSLAWRRRLAVLADELKAVFWSWA